MTAHRVEAVFAAAIDGRAQTIFHRQTQLEKLYNTIRNNASEIQEAILLDTLATTNEAAIEHLACLKCIKDAYESLSPAVELETEYHIANTRDSPDHRIPVGIVSIEPINHTAFYSVIAPLSSAIAAGNCTVVRLEQTLRSSSSLLKKLLTSSLEQDTIAVVNGSEKVDLPLLSVEVIQASNDKTPQINILASSSSAPVIATVDRTADLKVAAREIVAARLAFGGSSPYAPDVILVNEFVKQDFLREVVQECIGHSQSSNGAIDRKPKTSTTPSINSALDSLRKHNDSLRVIMHEQGFAVVDSSSPSLHTLTRQNSPILIVNSVRSPDDSIELVGRLKLGRCAATYHFANPGTAKYLAQFIPSEVSFINHIPSELLLGPRHPIGHPINLATRYQPQLFTTPAPQFINPSEHSQILGSALRGSSQNALVKLTSHASTTLPVTKRPSGKGIGFFEQGLLFNASLILLSFMSVSVAGVYYGRKAFQ